MKWRIALCTILMAVGTLTAVGQSPTSSTPSSCPEGLVCITREAAQKALEAGDKAKALEAELATQKQAYEKMRDALNDMRIQFASVSGENTILKQQQVADRALMTVLVQNTKKKRFGLINIF